MPEHPVVIPNEGQQIVGMFHLPEDVSTPRPAVIFFHGFTGNMQEPHRIFVQAARALASKGLAALRFDFRGSGDSEGDFSEMTLSSELSDARTALAWLRDRSEVDADRVGVVAMSLGGLIGAEILGEDPRLGAASLWCPVADTREAIKRRASASAAGQMVVKGSYDMNGWEVSRTFVEELAKSRPLESIANSAADVLLIHGDEDQSVPVADTHAYAAALQQSGREVETHILKGANHTFDSLKWVRDVVATTAAWFAKRL